MNEWTPVIYVTGKRNAAAMRPALKETRVRVVVDARIPLIYSKRIDVAYLSTLRLRLWRRLPDEIRNAFLTEPENHWLPPSSTAQVGLAVRLRHDSSPAGGRAGSAYQLVSILTNLDRDIISGSPQHVALILDRVTTALAVRPPDLRGRKTISVGFFHEDLFSYDLGFEELAHVLATYFTLGGGR